MENFDVKSVLKKHTHTHILENISDMLLEEDVINKWIKFMNKCSSQIFVNGQEITTMKSV